ncbi:MAG: hypothetical protein JW738_08030 [Actinobacteria bacterium]|nr:hypothetical protein [Actinomycetota bacterium]
MFANLVVITKDASSLNYLWMFILNFLAFTIAAAIAFAAIGKPKLLFDEFRYVPYAVTTVFVGFLIDALFVFLSRRFFSLFNPTAYYQVRFFLGETITSKGQFAGYSLSYLVIPSIVALLLGLSLQLVLVKYVFFTKLRTAEVLVVSMIVALALLPTWTALAYH